MKVESIDVIMQWLVRWAAMMYSRYKTGADGKTAYQRQKGKPCRMEVVPYGETVMFKKVKHTGQRKNILDTDCEEGLWLGHTRTSTEVLIGTAEGVVRAWAVRRTVAEERWFGAAPRPGQIQLCQVLTYPSGSKSRRSSRTQ